VPTGHAVVLPLPTYIARNANRKRAKRRPHHPTDLQFEFINDAILDSFLLADIKVNGRRHLIFATNAQLKLLVKAENWFLDGTFQVVNKSFTQLYSVHTFVRAEECMKQVPLVFVLTSGKKTVDYKRVFQSIVDEIKENEMGPLSVKTMTGKVAMIII